MAPADPAPHVSSRPPGDAGVDPAAATGQPVVEPVSQEELNAWRRGITPQAEIWNGRLAMLGLSMGLVVLILARLAGHHG